MDVGFIGLGLMGRGMAIRLRQAGHQLWVHDVRREAAEPLLGMGACWAETPSVVASQCEVVFTSLPRPADVETVAGGDGGLMAGFGAGKTWFDLSTNSVESIRALAARLKSIGAHMMDAPVSGGPAGAASGKLAIWVGGEREVFDKYATLLAAMADQARYVGEIGAGAIAKLVHNLTAAVMTQAIAEGMMIGVKAGMQPLQLYEAIRAGAMGRARAYDTIHRRWLPGKLDPPNFELQFLHKDVKLAVDLAREVGVPARLSQLALEEISEAVNRGWGRRDAQSVLLLQQERAGLPPFAEPEEAIDAVMKRS